MDEGEPASAVGEPSGSSFPATSGGLLMALWEQRGSPFCSYVLQTVPDTLGLPPGGDDWQVCFKDIHFYGPGADSATISWQSKSRNLQINTPFNGIFTRPFRLYELKGDYKRTVPIDNGSYDPGVLHDFIEAGWAEHFGTVVNNGAKFYLKVMMYSPTIVDLMVINPSNNRVAHSMLTLVTF